MANSPTNPAPPGAQPSTPTPAATPPDPYAWVKTGSDKLDRDLKKALVFMEPYWKATFAFLLLFLAFVVVPVLNWVDWLGWQTGLAFVVTLGFVVRFLVWTKEPRKGWRRWLRVAGLVLMPVVLPPIFALYVVLIPRNLDRRIESVFHSPKIYYIWAVNEGDFNSADKERLARWNPDKEANREVRSLTRMAALSVGIRTDGMAAFEAAPKEDDQLSVIIFQSRTVLIMPPAPPPLPTPDEDKAKKDKDKPAPPPPPQPLKVAQLEVCFVTAVSLSEAVNIAKDVEGDKKTPRFKNPCEPVPANLDLTFDFWVQGFSKSTGNVVDLSLLRQKIEDSKAPKGEGAGKPVIEGK